MDLTPYVEELRRQLAVAAAAGGDEATALAERLVAPLDAAMRLTMLDLLSTAADEITRELAPGSVDVRVRRGEPELVVTLPPADEPASPPRPRSAPPADDEGGTSRINLRLPDRLKGLVEAAAEGAGLSVNAWMVRTVAAAVDGDEPRRPPTTSQPDSLGRHRQTGWVR